jgi:predicted ATPase
VFPYALLAEDVTTDAGPTSFTERVNSAGRALRGIAYHRFNPTRLRRASAAWTDGANWPVLAEDGLGLPTLLASLAHRAPRSFIRLEDAFNAQVSTLAGFRVVETSIPVSVERGGMAGFQLQFQLKGGGELTPSEVSDGTMLLLAMLALAHSPNPPEVLLVEEPENGVHPSRLQEIVRVFRGLSSEGGANGPTQVVMTTHAPYLLDAMRPEEVFFCHRLEDGRATCTRLADVPGVREELEYKLLGELWAEHGEAELYRRWAATRVGA